MEDKLYFDGLNSVLSGGAPSVPIDPIMVDCQGMDAGKLSEVIKSTAWRLETRKKYAGIQKAASAFVCSKKMAEQLSLEFVDVVLSDHLPMDTAYLLTKEVDDRQAILPSDDLTWEEFFQKVLRGEQCKLIVAYPWLQARFDNIQVG